MHDFDLGPVAQPFKALAGGFPDEAAYPFEDFRDEWGPIFHRGRVDDAPVAAYDLPAGIPAWMYDDGWARRIGDTPEKKRKSIAITVPTGIIP